MTEQEQQLAILKATGWEFNETVQRWVAPNTAPIAGRLVDVPDYLNDLNAMHEAEKTCILAKGLTKTYSAYLYEIINQTPVEATGLEYDDLVLGEEVSALRIHATASQRAEAFLRTLNLWKE